MKQTQLGQQTQPAIPPGTQEVCPKNPDNSTASKPKKLRLFWD